MSGVVVATNRRFKVLQYHPMIARYWRCPSPLCFVNWTCAHASCGSNKSHQIKSNSLYSSFRFVSSLFLCSRSHQIIIITTPSVVKLHFVCLSLIDIQQIVFCVIPLLAQTDGTHRADLFRLGEKWKHFIVSECNSSLRASLFLSSWLPVATRMTDSQRLS